MWFFMSGCRSIDFGCQVVDGSENQVSGHTHMDCAWNLPGISRKILVTITPTIFHTIWGRHWEYVSFCSCF